VVRTEPDPGISVIAVRVDKTGHARQSPATFAQFDHQRSSSITSACVLVVGVSADIRAVVGWYCRCMRGNTVSIRDNVYCHLLKVVSNVRKVTSIRLLSGSPAGDYALTTDGNVIRLRDTDWLYVSVEGQVIIQFDQGNIIIIIRTRCGVKVWVNYDALYANYCPTGSCVGADPNSPIGGLDWCGAIIVEA